MTANRLPAAELAANRIHRAKPVSEAKPSGALRGEPKNKGKTKRPAGSRIGVQSNSKGEARERGEAERSTAWRAKEQGKTKRPAGSRIGGQSNSKGEAREAKYKQYTININTGGN